MSYYMGNNSNGMRSDIPVIRLGTSSASFSSSGVPLFIYILLFLVLFAVVFFVFRWLKSLLPKGGLLGEDNPILKPSDELDKEVADRSKDRMSNGESYISAAAWLFEELVGNAPSTLFKDVDEESVGAFMKNVKKEEYRQLENTYNLYRKSHGILTVVGIFSSDTLTQALKRAFDSKERQEYLSHLGIL